MDYEKKYKEALEIAQKLYQDCPNGKNDRLYHTTDLEKMFPELCESEDEKIRKELIEHVKDQQSSFISAPDCRDKYEEEENDKYNSWLAWLEKQKEYELSKDLGEYVTELNKQFPEVSFAKLSRIAVKVKNWLEKQGKQRANLIDIDAMVLKYSNTREKETNGLPVNCQIRSYRQGINDTLNLSLNIEKQDEQKPVSKEYTFKSIPRLLDMIEPTDRAKAYCQKLIDTLAKEEYNTDAKIVEGVLKGWNGEDVPMAVMDEKQGEQKPADKAKPFDKYEGLTDFERTLADICIGWIGEELGWKQYIKDNANVLLKIAIEKFNSVQDTPFEQKPIIEMKSAEESLGISSEEYNDIVNECLYGESESSDKVELKFKVGDWITNGDYTWKIIEVKPLDYILQSQDGNIVDDTISHVDEQFHSFSIEDAKDGDVLASELCDSIILFRGIKDDNIDFYCDYDFSKIDIPGDRFTVNNGQHYGNVEDSKDFYPATKEQRDILFSKMHEAGYEWNAEKKELKKISQRMISAEAKEALYDKPTDEEMKELLRTEYEKGRADTIAEMEKDWSEEDEVKINRIVACLENLNVADNDILLKDVDWLKSLKDRVIPKPKHEWSIEDERTIAIINNALTESNTPPDDYDKVYDWLESIKQRIGWKPSNEQIEALEHFVRSIGESGYASPYDNNTKLLYSLLEQLKKLTE